MEAKKIKKPRGTKIKIYSIAPPKYMFEVLADNYKKANIILEKASEKAVEHITKIGGEGYLEEG
jgi:translation initiation factor 2 alpha subunit (eIF-2alpha)